MRKNGEPAPVVHISGKELGQILKICGYTQKEFALHVGKSPAHICQTLLIQRDLELRYVDGLKELVGEDNFMDSILRIRKAEELRETKPEA